MCVEENCLLEAHDSDVVFKSMMIKVFVSDYLFYGEVLFSSFENSSDKFS